MKVYDFIVQISLLPKTHLGRWSAYLTAAIILLCILVLVLEYQVGLGLGSDSILLMILAIAIGISGAGALVIGLISIIKNKERSNLVFFALVVGLFAFTMAVDMIIAIVK